MLESNKNCKVLIGEAYENVFEKYRPLYQYARRHLCYCNCCYFTYGNC